MSSSEDDVPLAMLNGRRTNGTSSATSASTNGKGPILPDRIPKSVDKKADKDFDAMAVDYPTGDRAGVPIVNIAVREELDNGRAKRKGRKPAIKEESSDDSDTPLTKRRRTSNGVKASTIVESSDDDVPLAKRAAASKTRTNSASKAANKKAAAAKDESSDSDTPLATMKLAKEKRKIENKAAATAKELRAEDKKAAIKANGIKRKSVKDESDSDVPLKAKRKPVVKTNGVKQESSDDDVPLAKKAKAISKNAATAKGKAVDNKKAVVKGKAKAAKEDTPAGAETAEDEEYKWWENQAETDGTQKWTTLEHNGVLFPPAYEPLPKNVKLKYDGVPVTLPLAAEEVAGFFGHMLNSTHATNPTFTANFFKDFQRILKESGGAKDTTGKKVLIKEFAKCDFTDMNNYFVAEAEAKKNLSSAEKKAIKAEKDKAEEKYLHCLLDGRKEKVGNFRIEPPGLFRGRGEHPKTGMVKQRVQPEQVTINIGNGVPVPPPPPGHKWADVIHDNTVTWLATWKENINGNIKYVMLAATSSLKGMSDFKKFEKARELKKHIDRIRADYGRDLKSELMADRQRATAMYLIDRLALRAGNEKGEDEADTVGCCSLRFEHVTLKAPDLVIFDFLGKDSIRFYQEVPVIPQVFKNMRIFKKAPKTTGDMIFDRLDTSQLNKHLQNYMPGLSAKVFRTYNASWTMQQQLAKIPNEGSIHDKYAAYNEANKAVAILCNHQRTVSASHETMMLKAEEKIKALRYQKLRLKRQILFLKPELKKKRAAFFKPDPEIDDKNWILEHQKFLIEQEKEKIRKKFEKENEKAAENGEKEQKPSELKERLKAVSELEAEFKAENKTGAVEPKTKGATVEKLEAQIEKMDEKILKQETEAKVREDNKTVALGTSKINYIDPRLSVMFCKKYDVPIEKVFAKTLREKFKWALESADEDWEF
ncbi:uncharacterized protein LAJ45_04528 [Morchella importuna]|uniref:uncharacterized protein n=1 Tax=Morchella importuna TaxID=1174673 RepID=UPI001E8E348D|nr:uncharacterized protein LAJ45_04528 [Morchella importuna]KAH8151326.1 hypothetical protein LAJ45_04528 [Morchella importuna]